MSVPSERFSKENNWFRLKGKCFACNRGNEGDSWNHKKESCICDYGCLYINDSCNISCDECDKPSFILHWRFNCGAHSLNKNNGYWEPRKNYLIAAISNIAKMEDIPDHIFREMNKILLEC